jgi:predicted NBD/HSP70 family sugar kinase
VTVIVPHSAAWAPKPFPSPRAVRRHNLGVVLRHVVVHGPRSRATIAQETGLNKTTVSRLVGELIELGLLLERGIEARGRAGRPGHVVDVARDGAVALGLEINVDYLSVQATDLAGGSRYRAREGGDNRGQDAGVVLDRLAALVGGALDEVRAQGVRAIGATVALPGLVDVGTGTLLAAPNLGWSDVAVVDGLSSRLAVPLALHAENEANLAALAELWEGVAVDIADFMYASGQVGVGGGIVLGGELFRGYRGFGGELGHMVIDAAGAPCACGSRGCLETRCGLEPLLASAGALPLAPGSARPVVDLARRARAQDPDALAALDACGSWLGIALGNVANLLSPQAVVLGGYFAPLATWLAPAIEHELSARVLGGSVPPVLTGSLGAEAAVRGAAATQLRRVLADPIRVGQLTPEHIS